MVKKTLMLAGFAFTMMASTPSYAADEPKATAAGSCDSGSLNDRSERGEQVRAIEAAINARITEPQRWKGKQCRIQLKFARDGMLVKASTSDGDKAYCEALVFAAAKAKFPAFTHPEIFHACKNTRLDMRG